MDNLSATLVHWSTQSLCWCCDWSIHLVARFTCAAKQQQEKKMQKIAHLVHKPEKENISKNIENYDSRRTIMTRCQILKKILKMKKTTERNFLLKTVERELGKNIQELFFLLECIKVSGRNCEMLSVCWILQFYVDRARIQFSWSICFWGRSQAHVQTGRCTEDSCDKALYICIVCSYLIFVKDLCPSCTYQSQGKHPINVKNASYIAYIHS